MNTGVPNMAETIPLSPDQVNACVGSVNGTSKKGGRITHSSLRMPMLFLAALACVQTPVNAWEAELGCEKFSEVFTGGKDVCESIFGDAFVYSEDEDKAYTMWWFGGENPNNKVAANLGLAAPDTCELQYKDLSHPKPTKESDDFTECVPWKDEACCKHSTVKSADAIRKAYGEGYEWDRCGPMSPECSRFFVQEACLYECDVHSGLYRKCSDAQVDAAADNEDDPCHNNYWQIVKMPIKASYCNAWYESCRNDYFCSGKNFYSCNAHYWKKDEERKKNATSALIAESTATLQAELQREREEAANKDAGYIAGYAPYTNVTQHSNIDLDQKLITDAVKVYDWSAAATVYNEGQNSLKSSGKRTLKGFSVNNCKLSDEKYFKIFNKYWTSKGLNKCEYANDIVTAALTGGKIAQSDFTFANKDDQYRKEAVQKSIVYQNVFMYTIWEMQDAINDCKEDGDLRNNDNSVHAWDEAVAYYTGSLEGPNQGGEQGLRSKTSNGQLLFNLAEKRCQNFGTCTGDFDGSEKEGYAQVNNNIFDMFSKAREALHYATETQNFECPGIFEAKDEIVSQMVVPLLQGTLRYLYKTDKLINVNPSGKELGELFAFASSILPLVHNCDADVAQKLMDRAWSGAEISFEELKKGLESTYLCMGISCRDVGALCDLSASTVGGCKPYLKGEKSYDTSVCEAEKVTCDENYYCSNWSKDGFCASNSYVKDNCAKACKDKDQNNKCQAWIQKDKFYCKNNDYVKQFCPESCAAV